MQVCCGIVRANKALQQKTPPLRYGARRGRSTYSLDEIKALIHQKSYFITDSALYAAKHDFGLKPPKSILDFITQELTEDDFYKTEVSDDSPEGWDNVLWQDVYKKGDFYIKLQIQSMRRKKQAVVVSFHKRV